MKISLNLKIKNFINVKNLRLRLLSTVLLSLIFVTLFIFHYTLFLFRFQTSPYICVMNALYFLFISGGEIFFIMFIVVMVLGQIRYRKLPEASVRVCVNSKTQRTTLSKKFTRLQISKE